jgi:hypothetical protein
MDVERTLQWDLGQRTAKKDLLKDAEEVSKSSDRSLVFVHHRAATGSASGASEPSQNGSLI